jgi:hypothetical protein
MVGKPAEAPTPGASENAERRETGEGAPARERIGPLAIERLSKDDGRALILYSSVEPPRR